MGGSLAGMDRSIYGFIFRHSKTQQIFLLVITCAAFPFIYLQPDLVKRIINDAIGGSVNEFPKNVLSFAFEQLAYLVLVCCGFLVIVVINGAFKYYINVSKGRLGERMLRRLRYTLYSRVLRFPQPHFKRVSQGEIIPMITQEVEPLGGFIGDALAQPVFQAGMLMTFLMFIIVQDLFMGLRGDGDVPDPGLHHPAPAEEGERPRQRAGAGRSAGFGAHQREHQRHSGSAFQRRIQSDAG